LKAVETRKENQYEDKLSERADKAVLTKKRQQRALKAWNTRRMKSTLP
jgi:hypothetical protein